MKSSQSVPITRDTGPFTILCVGFHTEIETRIITAFEETQPPTEIVTATDQSDAIEYLETQSIDCVISSDTIEDGSGIDLLHATREVSPTLPYFLFVEDLSHDFINEAIDAGVTDYLPQGGGKTQASRLANRVLTVISQCQSRASTAELERINTVIRDLNRELVRASTRDEIDQRVCDILSASDPYLFAWIGEHESESHVVTGRAAAGVEDGYLDEIMITTDEEPTAQGPTGRAVTTHEMQVLQNIPEDPAFEPWREQALERGYRSSAAIPLVYDETLYGVLNVYADRTGAFDVDEQELLEELGTTIAYAHHELQIHREAHRFHRAVEQAADSIFITNSDGMIEYVNPAFEELTGYDASEAIGRNPRILKSGEQSIEYYERMWETILGGNIWESEIIDTKRSGEPYYAEQTVAPLRDESNTVEGFVAIQRDITERKERERELQQSKDRLRLLFDEAPDGIVVHDSEGEIQDVNEALVENLGYTREELLSMNVFDIETGADEAILQNQWESMDPGSVSQIEIEGVHQRRDGSTYPCEIWISRVASEFDTTDRFIALIRDITERKRREREQRETKRRLELAVETADAGVWEWDIQSEAVLWEESMEALLGLSPGTFDGTYGAFIERVHPEDRSAVEQTIGRALKRRTDFEREFRLRHESGDFVWILARARLFTAEDNTPDRMIGVGIDISDRYDRTRQLKVLDRVLRHNLRNDMTTIQGYAETIQTEVDGVDEEVAMILDTSQELMTMVEKEREIVEVISGHADVERIDIVNVCQRIVDELRESYSNSIINFDHPREQSVTATTKIGRGITELIENALVHNDRDQPEVSLTIKAVDETVRIKIADNGPGIPEREVNVLTREYEVGPLYHGSGLGLWLVNWIIKRSDGTLRFEENDPRGSVITIELQQPS